jgi:hypothetical protein
MDRAILEKLARTQDLRVLAENVRTLCEAYGPVKSYDCIRLQQAGDEQVVVCLVGLESDRQQSALIRELGARPFGAGVCLKITQRGPRR